MKSRGWGRILCVTSIAAKQPVENLMLSNSLRAAVTGLREDPGPRDGEGRRHREHDPSRLHRDRARGRAVRRDGAPRARQPRPARSSEIPMGRLGEPKEFAGLAAFLVSDRAGYITGESFAVDGGWLRGLF